MARSPRSPSFRSSWRTGAIAVLALLLAPLLLADSPGGEGAPAALHGQDRSISLDRFDAEITVRPDGSLDVVETLDVRFQGSWNGVFRDLLTRHETAEGRGARLRYDFGEVTDGDGRPLRVDREGISGGHRLRIWVPDARDAVRTVVLRYRVEGGLRFFDEGPGGMNHDELYWNATGSDWEGPIREARTRVRLPEGATGVEAWGYTGRTGSTEQAVNVRVEGPVAEIEATRELRPSEGLTVSVVWDPGVVERPTVAQRTAGTLRSNWPFGLPILAFILMYRAWNRRGRDPQRGALMVHYEPPDDLSPAEVGTVVDHRAEAHDITATLVDLAVRGYLTIEEKDATGLLSRFTSSKEYTFHLRRPRTAWTELRPHERAYMEGIFTDFGREGSSGLPVENVGEAFELAAASFQGWRKARREGGFFDADAFLESWKEERDGKGEGGPGGVPGTGLREGDEPLQSVDLSDLENEFYTHLDRIRKKIYGRLKEKGIYERRPDHAPGPWLMLAGALLIGAFFLGGFLSDTPRADLALPLGVGLALSGAIVGAFGFQMGVRTWKGVRVLEEVLGFKEFLGRVEEDRFRRMITSPDQFEEYLPYAMALQVDERWAKAFDDLYREPPDWYRGSAAGAGFRASAFASSMSSMCTQASRSMASSPSSSGAGGGGSAGGGSGGGGGGGF